MSRHLEITTPIEASKRDQLRDELGHYASSTIFLDGVSRDEHQSAVINNPYYLDAPQHTSGLVVQDSDPLFDLA